MKKQADVIEALRKLGFRASQEALRALLQDATKRRLSPTQFTEKLAQLERGVRDENNLNRRTRAATLGRVHALDSFDWNHPREIDRDLFEWLATLEFVGDAHNVLLRGPAGVGKTTLAKNLGFLALQSGYSVGFRTVTEVLAELLMQESLPALERRLRRYTAVDLLILDEIGYIPCDNRAADILYNIISRRHEKKATVITTNLPFKQWGTVFPGAACVSALVDRFVQHCHVIDIEAESWRQKDGGTPAAKNKETARKKAQTKKVRPK